MLESAVRICEAKFGIISRWDGEPFTCWQRTIWRRHPLRHASTHRGASSNPLIARMLAEKTAVQVPDAAATPGYLDRSDPESSVPSTGRRATCMLVPMLEENEVIRSFTLFVRRFVPLPTRSWRSFRASPD